MPTRPRTARAACALTAVVAAGVFGVLIFAWTQQSVDVKSSILAFGWPALYILTVLQTVFMVRKLLRRQRGFVV